MCIRDSINAEYGELSLTAMPKGVFAAGALLLLTLISIASSESYKQKLDCLPGLDDCNEDYGEYDPLPTDYIKKRLGPGVALAVLCVLGCCLVWWCWCCCRCWARCNCCGCCRWCLCRCCCGAGTPESEMVYTKCQRMALLFVLFFAFLMLALGGALGYLGGHKTFDGGVDILDQAIVAIEEMETLNTNVAKVAFLSLTQFYQGAVSYDDASVTATIFDVKSRVSDAKDGMTNVKDIFNYALPGIYGLFAAITLLGFFSWCCGIACCSMTMGMIASFFLILAWILFGAFWLSGALIDDTCVNLSEHYALDCMKQPGYTCPNAKLTELFQCPKLSTVSQYYADAWNLLDTAASNGAGTNAYGHNAPMINPGYNAYTSAAYGTRVTPLAPAVSTGVALGMEPYTTCKSGYSFNTANVGSSTSGAVTAPITGARSALCETGSTNTGQAAPQNTAQTVGSYVTTGLTANAGSTNPIWTASTANGGETIGTCERACLNASSYYADGVLDSLTNFGGNCMFRKFLYESFTSVYSSGNQGYAACSTDIKWTDITELTDYAIYQNYSSWMATYSAMATSGSECVSSTHCIYENANREIPWTTAGGTNPACYQAAAMAVSDIMFALSYIASCYYIKSFAFLTAVQSTGACFDLGDGLVLLVTAQALVGCGFFMLIVVGVMGYRRFDSNNDPSKKAPKEEPMGLYVDSGFKEEDTPYNEDHAPYPVASTEMEQPV
eukprot:TRINITY_DN1495_c0_g1_i1.p1 TRINITY_DN1495_c0_g1~~TRINITY_DN1495_c0_g1_i1.p1  ORF type:complete len:725 (+),score=144.10 TRINITY_DN1495_c0_g1_i1:95-2269(+)